MDAKESWITTEHGIDDEEDIDEELLRNAPCANDSAPVWNNSWEAAAPRVTTNANATDAPGTEAAASGICVFPPLAKTSFMMRGDDGVVRWVTASGMDVRRAARKRRREGVNTELGQPHEKNDEQVVIEEEEEEEDGLQQLMLGITQRRHRHHDESGLGHVNIVALLQRLYEEAANDAVGNGGMVQQSQPQPQQEEPVPKGEEDTLWVLKYKPKRFRDLLSDDTINLRLLQWLKSWDAYTFRDTSATDVAPARPDNRLAVLVGPPGVGKTTLAHVLAIHCGYDPLEINASVDRTESRIESAIRLAVAPARTRRRTPLPLTSTTTTASTSLIPHRGAHHDTIAGGGELGTSLLDVLLRPRCLIIDEMDGIAANVATFLLQQDIHCPVLCLCNDYYVPSLRALRRQCQHVYNVPPIRPQRLLSRLQEIAERERLLVGQPVLADLVQSSNGDVRCCLNTLQFIQRQVSPAGGSNEVIRLMREMQSKDTQVGIWDTWRIMFERQDRSKYIHLLRKEYSVDYEANVILGSHSIATGSRSLLNGSHQEPQERGREWRDQEPLGEKKEEGHVAQGFRVDPGHMYVSRVVQQCADTNTLLDGLQEYYLQRSYADYSFQRTCTVADAFSFQDRITTCAYRQASSAMMLPFVNQYAHTTAVTCFNCCSTMGRSGAPLGFPREAANASRRFEESLHVALTFRDGCRLETAAHLWSVDVVSLEVAPMLVRCLCDVSLRMPAHSVSSLSAFSRHDQQLLRGSITRHAMYGLTYARSSSLLSSPHSGAADGSSDMVEEHWELSPPIHHIGCVALYALRSSKPMSRAAALPASPSMVLRMKGELRQLMVGEIQRFVIQSMAPKIAKGRNSSNTTETVAEKAAGETASITTTKEEERKRGRNEGVEVLGDGVSKRPNVGDVTKAVPPLTLANANSVSAAAASGLERVKPSGKRDFFGRPIPDGGAPSGKRTCMRAARVDGQARAPATFGLTVQYTYHDGSTNAVRMPASFDDF